MRPSYFWALVPFCAGLAVLQAASPVPPKSASTEPAAVNHAKPAREATGVERTNTLGWADSYVLSGSAVRAVIVPDVGGRILQYSLNGQNILFEGGDQASASQARGYQCDVGPELRGIPAHERLWLGPYQSELLDEPGIGLKSSPDPKLGLELEKEIVIDLESGDLGITQRMRNVSSNETSFCLWDRTTCKGGGFAFFPLRKKSHFPARWSMRRTVGTTYTYDGAKPQSPNVKVMNGVLIAKCEGEATKLGADSEAGWIAYVRGRLLFVKYFPAPSKGHYSDGGNSVELYFDRETAELEPLSPETKLKSGETFDFPEKWTLIELDTNISSFAEVRGLVDKIPPSPF